MRSVASQVRASTRKGPSEPSYFVRSILKELGAYLGGAGRVVDEGTRTRWATTVVEDIAGRCVPPPTLLDQVLVAMHALTT